MESLVTIFQNGICEDCGGQIIVFEQELLGYKLDPEGLPERHNVEYTKIISYCERCEKRFDLVKTGIGFARRSAIEEKESAWLKAHGKVDRRDVVLREPNPFKKISRRAEHVRWITTSNQEDYVKGRETLQE